MPGHWMPWMEDDSLLKWLNYWGCVILFASSSKNARSSWCWDVFSSCSTTCVCQRGENRASVFRVFVKRNFFGLGGVGWGCWRSWELATHPHGEWKIHLESRIIGLWLPIEQWKKPGCLGYVRDYTTQLYRDFNYQYKDPIFTNQYDGK